MVRRYAAFLLRWWRADAGEQRIEIEQVRTGERVRVDSVQAAVEWIRVRCDEVADARPPPADGAAGTRVVDE